MRRSLPPTLADMARLLVIPCARPASRVPAPGRDSGAPRFFVDPGGFPRNAGSSCRLDNAQDLAHLKTLRMKTGSVVDICDGAGSVVRCELTTLDRRQASAMSIADPETFPWPGPQVTLGVGCSTLKGGRSDWLIEKATEIGAIDVLPMETERCGPVKTGREERLERVAVAASQQSQRNYLLQVRPPCTMEEVYREIEKADLALIAQAEGAHLLSILDDAADRSPTWTANGSGKILLLIGPEGDFTSEEVDKAIAAGAISVSLGPHRLRTETAALVLLSTVQMYGVGARDAD